jgi:hypothetical protein
MKGTLVAVLAVLAMSLAQSAPCQHRDPAQALAPTDVSDSSETATPDSSTGLEGCRLPDVALPPLPEDSRDWTGADYYCRGCKPLRIEGDSIPTLDVGRPSSGQLQVIPDFSCIRGYHWAGISMGLSQQLVAFSADSRRFIHCDHDCEIIDVATGKPVATVKKQREDIDGSPISRDPAIAPVLSELGAPSEEGAWPYDDLVLTWSVTKDCRAVTAYLAETSTGVERAIARVVDDHLKVFPSHVVLSPDSRWLAIVFMKIGGPPIYHGEGSGSV